MAWNGSGSFTRTNGDNTGTALWQQDAADGDNIEADRHDVHDQDLAAGIQACLAKNGENTPSADLPMATYKHTGVGNATARTHYAAAGQIQDNALQWGGTAGGSANTYTLTQSPAASAYATGQRFAFKVDAAKGNTGASTLNINGLGAKAIKRGEAAAALQSGDMPAGWIAEVLYDGTQFILLNPCKLAADAVTTAMFCGVNNAYLRWKSTGGTDISALAVNASDNTVLNCASGQYTYLATNGVVRWGVKHDAATAYGFHPDGNNTQDLGLSTNRVRYAHLGTGIGMPSNAVTAAAPTATQITANGFSIISSGGASQSVRLPAAAAGDICILVNTSAQTVIVNTKNPASDTVNGSVMADGAMAMTPGAGWIFHCYEANKWASVA